MREKDCISRLLTHTFDTSHQVVVDRAGSIGFGKRGEFCAVHRLSFSVASVDHEAV